MAANNPVATSTGYSGSRSPCTISVRAVMPASSAPVKFTSSTLCCIALACRHRLRI